MTKRCKFCAKKLDENGQCNNEKCPEKLRNEIVGKAGANIKAGK